MSWEGTSAVKKRRSYYICYTVCYVITAFLCYGVFLLCERDIIWLIDGLEQYLPYFIYEGDWIRSIVTNLFDGNGFQPEFWSNSIGFGSDTLSTLDVFWDPLNMTSALVPAQYAEYMFSFLVIVRGYLAGITFSVYARYRGNHRFTVICGALVYALSMPALIGSLWPAGVNPLILFPLLLFGVEKILAREKPYVFIVACALFLIISSYQAYAAFILLFFYCAVRVFSVEEHMTVAKFFLWVAKFFGFLLIGAAISAISLIPSALAILGTDRGTDTLAQVPLFYEPAYYGELISGFLSSADAGSDCAIGFGGLAFICCILLYYQKHRFLALKLCFIVFVIFLLLPFFGSLFNGFNYATNRWIWAFSFLVCYIITVTAPRLETLSDSERRGLIFWSLIFGVILFVNNYARTEKVIAAFVAMLVLIMTVLLLQKSSESRRRVGVMLCTTLCLFINAFYYIDSEEGGRASTCVPVGTAYTLLTEKSPNYVAANIDDYTFWRYDALPNFKSNQSTWTRMRNDSVVQHLNGTDFYYSIYNNRIDHYLTELGVCGAWINFSYGDLDARSSLEVLSCVKYLLAPQDCTGKTYNYSTNIAAEGTVRDKEVVAYEGDVTLPMGYAYSHTIDRSVYDQLSPIQKQEALLQGVVIDSSAESSSDVTAIQPTLTSTDVTSRIVSTNGITLEGTNSLLSAGGSSSITFSIDGLTESETYLYFNNLNFTGLSYYAMLSDNQKSELSEYELSTLENEAFAYRVPNTYNLYVSADNGFTDTAITNGSKSYHMYGGKSNWALNLGYSDDAQHTVTITFPNAGRYTFDSASFVCQPMTNFTSQVNALKENALQDLVVSTNKVTGSVDLDESKYIYFSIPYQDGWSALVDGKPVKIEKANTAFMAIEVPEGYHDIELNYLPSYLLPAGLISLAGVAVFTVLILCYRRRERQSRLY